MKNIKLIIVLGLVSLGFSQKQVSLTGVVLDKDGKAVIGAVAELKTLGLKSITNSKGEYSLTEGVLAIGDAFNRGSDISISRKVLTLGLNTSKKVSISVFDVNGRVVSSVFSGMLDAGQHKIDAANGNTGLDAGMYFVRAIVGSDSHTFKLNANSSRVLGNNSAGALRKSAVDEDSLSEVVQELLETIEEDTLVLSKDGMVFDEVIIDNFVAELPESFIVQRDIYGDFSPVDQNMVGVELVVSGDGILGEKLVKMGFNKQAHSFSGFVYLKYVPGELPEYQVYVNALDSMDRTLGRSVTVDFDQNFGDIKVPTFSTYNAKPVITFETFTNNVYLYEVNSTICSSCPVVKKGEALKVIKSVADGFDGTVDKIEVDTGAGFFEVDTSFTISYSESNLNSRKTISKPFLSVNGLSSIIVRVTDNDGIEVLDTIMVGVESDLPYVNGQAVNNEENGGLYIQAHFYDLDGEIVKVERSITIDGADLWEEVTADDYVKTLDIDESIISYSQYEGLFTIDSESTDKEFIVKIRVTDGDDNVVTAEFIVE